ncbi:MAG TPA: OmpW family outer membrane protein [Thermoanaerobaculia bacterium]|nr:OmpW family outer membrane protein [Thermoanaerobaculia bacterium]
MIRIFYRVLFVMFILAGLRAAAQSSTDVALWLVDSELTSSSVVDEGDVIEFDFDEEVGYGLSFNHFWTNAFSTELALQKYSADMTIGSNLGPAFIAGELRVTTVTAMAQWHFNRDGRFSPYVGGGIARVGGDFEFASGLLEPGDEESVEMESETTWTAAVGANVRLTEHLALTGEMKGIPWDAREEGGLPEDEIAVDPVTFAVGVRFRF